MTTRIKKLKSPAVKSRSQMEILVREIAGLKLNGKLLVDNMDAEIQSVRQSYESRLATISQVLADKLDAARTWSESNPAEFADRKSIEFNHGIVGFRTGKPKLKTAPKCNWDGVLETLRSTAWGTPYVRVKEEINKEQIIADVTARKLSEAVLLKAGALVVQEETFYAEPKLTHLEPREVAQVA